MARVLSYPEMSSRLTTAVFCNYIAVLTSGKLFFLENKGGKISSEVIKSILQLQDLFCRIERKQTIPRGHDMT